MITFTFKAIALLILVILTSCGNVRTGPGGEGPTVDSVGVDSVKPNVAIKPSMPIKPMVHVYIENTRSMDGYVKGATGFEQTIFSFLTDINISGAIDSLNLFYINSLVIPHTDNLSEFIERLDPATFRKKGGNRGVTELADIVNAVLLRTGPNDISIFVTDGIFSPGRNRNALEYLKNQQIRFRDNMHSHLARNPETAIVINRQFSNFDGEYFNRYDTPIIINEPRPYYIWIIGNIEHVNQLFASIPKRTQRLFENSFTITRGNREVDYAVKINSGRFNLYRGDPQKTITNLRRDRRSGVVQFSVDANLSGLLLSDSYLLDPNNYTISTPNFEFTIKQAASNPHGYTHTFDFTADRVHKGKVALRLKSQIPGWIEEINDDLGLAALEGRTFGIKYQISGVYEAFTFDTAYYTEISINIK